MDTLARLQLELVYFTTILPIHTISGVSIVSVQRFSSLGNLAISAARAVAILGAEEFEAIVFH